MSTGKGIEGEEEGRAVFREIERDTECSGDCLLGDGTQTLSRPRFRKNVGRSSLGRGVFRVAGHEEGLMLRKNWLHLAEETGATKVAAIISIVETCRRLDIKLRKYLGDVLPKLGAWLITRVGELTPTDWKAASSL